MFHRRCFSLLAISLVLSLPSFAQPTQQPSADDAEQQANAPAETVAVAGVVDDAAIRQRLTKIYDAASKAGWLTNSEVILDSGIVTLKGQADTDEHREWASNVARKTEDVVAVINELTLDDSVDLQSTQEVVQSSLTVLWTDFLKRSPLLIAALLVLVITYLFAKAIAWITHRLLDQRGIRSSLKDLVYQLTSIAVWIVGLLVATVIAFPGMTPSKALTVLGLGSVAIGFAFKDIFENFFAGILILWRYPFDRGDFITCEGLTGKVEQITIRNTLIRRLDGELAVVPNATLFKNNVDVLTSQPQRRVRLICGVAYDEDVDESRKVIESAVLSCESVQGKRTVEVFAQEFANSSVNFEVAWWTGSRPIDIRRSRDEVVAAIKRALDDAGIEIPFPYRTLTFKDPAIAQAIGAAVETPQPDEAPQPDER
ncbi:Small-conductance mechanosensitive channel [Novipirellula galeiformis]|uniref:Small-conductance mechanosensitive channel n=1 Tax=Novipirellula galeiformis TaxID=2528004 RepID=A0A5C6C902_9BACT|nr:mechanosensitive ion channel family protein [Novipirellula galeiformis]TWU20477.1 Small-conductance mechanosensitive channel [Novipirellula galeiformis]